MTAASEGKRRRRVRKERGEKEYLPSGSIRVRVRGVAADGRKYNLTQTITTGSVEEREREADRALSALLKRALDYESGAALVEEHVTLAEWCERAQRSGAVKLTGSQRSAWKGPCAPLHRLPLQQLDNARISAWVASLIEAGRAPAYARACWELVRKLVRAAQDARVIAVLPFSRPKGIPGEREVEAREPLTSAEVTAILEAASVIDGAGPGADGLPPSLRLRLWFQLQTGMRPVECAWTRPSDLRIEPSGCLVHVRAAKGSRDHDHPIPRALFDALRGYHESLPVAPRHAGPLFPVKRGHRWGARYVERKNKGRTERSADAWILADEVARLRELSGVAEFVAYRLRHTRYTAAGSDGLSEKQLQALGGWKSARMVGRYAHADRVELPAHAGRSVVPDLPLVPVASADVNPTNGAADPRRAHLRNVSADSGAHGRNDGVGVGSAVDPEGRGLAVGADAYQEARGKVARVLALAESAGGPDGLVQRYIADGADVDDLLSAGRELLGLARAVAPAADRPRALAVASAFLDAARRFGAVEGSAPTPAKVKSLVKAGSVGNLNRAKGMRAVGSSGDCCFTTNPDGGSDGDVTTGKDE